MERKSERKREGERETGRKPGGTIGGREKEAGMRGWNGLRVWNAKV